MPSVGLEERVVVVQPCQRLSELKRQYVARDISYRITVIVHRLHADNRRLWRDLDIESIYSTCIQTLCHVLIFIFHSSLLKRNVISWNRVPSHHLYSGSFRFGKRKSLSSFCEGFRSFSTISGHRTWERSFVFLESRHRTITESMKLQGWRRNRRN